MLLSMLQQKKQNPWNPGVEITTLIGNNCVRSTYVQMWNKEGATFANPASVEVTKKWTFKKYAVLLPYERASSYTK